jgi:hypothetical protein
MAKGSKKSPPADETGVLGSLPATRPTRLGRRRAETDGASTTGEPGSKKRAPARAASKPTAATAKPKATAAKPKATAAKPKAVAAKPAAPKRPTAVPSEPAGPRRPSPVREAKGPRPVRSGSPGLDAVPVEERPSTAQPPSGTELVSTVVKAAGEVAQIGLTVGGQILKRAVDRLPKP